MAIPLNETSNSIYIGSIKNANFDSIRKITNRVSTPHPLFLEPRIIVKFLVKNEQQIQQHFFYINPNKLKRWDWIHLKEAQKDEKIERIELYLTERENVSANQIPYFQEMFKILGIK
jgi:hypothetical protein